MGGRGIARVSREIPVIPSGYFSLPIREVSGSHQGTGAAYQGSRFASKPSFVGLANSASGTRDKVTRYDTKVAILPAAAHDRRANGALDGIRRRAGSPGRRGAMLDWLWDPQVKKTLAVRGRRHRGGHRGRVGGLQIRDREAQAGGDNDGGPGRSGCGRDINGGTSAGRDINAMPPRPRAKQRR